MRISDWSSDVCSSDLPVKALGTLAAGTLRVDDGSNVMPVLAQQRRQNLGIPAAAGGDFDHGLLRGHAEKPQRLRRMPPTVARGIGRVAPTAGDRSVQRR